MPSSGEVECLNELLLIHIRTNGSSRINFSRLWIFCIKFVDISRFVFLVSSSSPTATALTDAMSESVPFFFCSGFREDIFKMS